jgi:hypothetical protein
MMLGELDRLDVCPSCRALPGQKCRRWSKKAKNVIEFETKCTGRKKMPTTRAASKKRARKSRPGQVWIPKWERYKACETCGAKPGVICTSLQSKNQLKEPHAGRKRIE